MQRAAEEGDLERVRLFIDGGVSVDSRDDLGLTLLHWACRKGCLEVVKLLLVDGADTTIKDTRKNTALHWAAFYGRTQVVQVLLKQEGLDLNLQGENGYTPLHKACQEGCLEVIKLLLVAGADTTIRDAWKNTALHWAAYLGHKQVVQVLLEQEGLDLNPQDVHGGTPLYYACQEGCLVVVKLLLLAGADTTIRDAHKSTALHWAAHRGHTQVVQVLLEQEGVDLNPQDEDYYTPLHNACRKGCLEVVKQLLVAGADTTLKNIKGETALTLGVRLERLTLEEIMLFVQHGVSFEDCDYVRISQNPDLKESVLKCVDLVTKSVLNKFNRQSLPALKCIPNFPGKPSVEVFKSNAQHIREVENSVKCDLQTNTSHNVVKAPCSKVLRIACKLTVAISLFLTLPVIWHGSAALVAIGLKYIF